MGVADDPSVMVSHVNGDRLDCRCQNLFVRTRSEVAKARKPSPETVARLTPYPDPKRPGVWRVPLKSHLVRHEALIDEADLPIVQGRNWNWNPRTDGKIDGEVLLATTRARTPLSRIIMDADGVDDRVQYLNGDALDCRRANLIVRTCAEQVHTNGKMQSRGGQPCISRFKGVTWDKSREKWIVKICKDGVHRHIGRFGDELAAAEAYDEAARGLFGEHAYLNFPDGIDAWLEQQATELKTESAAPKREAA
jgi:hypothetical protein